MRIFLVEHSSGQVYEPTYTRIEKAFFCQDEAKEYVKNKTDEFAKFSKEHDALYDSHVKDCELDECFICEKWDEMQLERYDNHNWDVIEINAE